MVDNGMIFGERRHHHRKTCMRIVEIDDYKSRYKAHMRNLAASGAFIEPTSKIQPVIGQELSLTIPYGLKRKDVTIKAKVARVTIEGLGVQFMNTDLY